jgi:hypothetical protein
LSPRWFGHNASCRLIEVQTGFARTPKLRVKEVFWFAGGLAFF